MADTAGLSWRRARARLGPLWWILLRGECGNFDMIAIIVRKEFQWSPSLVASTRFLRIGWIVVRTRQPRSSRNALYLSSVWGSFVFSFDSIFALSRHLVVCPSNNQWKSTFYWKFERSTLSLPRVTINSKFPLQPHQKSHSFTSHGMKNFAFHSFLRWKMITLPILTTSLMHFSLIGWKNVPFELGSERVNLYWLMRQSSIAMIDKKYFPFDVCGVPLRRRWQSYKSRLHS